jgi:hypothetical protein
MMSNQEHQTVMSTSRTIQRALATAALLSALSVSAAQANDTVTFRDVLKPGGHTRSKSEKLADGAACGTSGPKHTIRVTMPVFEKCMRAKGWVLDHYSPDPSVPVHGTSEHYTDTRGDARGHPRGTAALHADESACKSRGRGSARLKQCLAARGWQLTLTQHGPAAHRPAPRQWTWSPGWGTSSPGSSTSLDDEMRRNDQSRAETQAASDAINASNASVAASQAAEQQRQNDLISANAPVQQQ